MEPGVILISLTKMDLERFLPLSRKLLGYSPAKAADGVTVPLQEMAHNLACVAAFKDEKASPYVKETTSHLNLFHAGFLIAAYDRDMVEILELTGMPFVLTETLGRDVYAAFICGSLSQWRTAVRLACHPNKLTTRCVRYAFNEVYKILCDLGLKDIFNNLQVTEQHDNTFLLEDKR